MEAQFGNCFSSFSDFKVSFTEGMFKSVPCSIRLVGAFSLLDVVFEDLLPIEDN